MIHISGSTAGKVWLKAATEVLNTGGRVMDGETKLRELLNVFLTIERPTDGDLIIKKYADPNMITWMKNNFLNTEPVLNWGYSYGQRFLNFDGVNQIDQVIHKLTKNIESKSATITLIDPKGDGHHMPCIVSIDFKIRNGSLMTTAFFRSQDVGKKLYADILSIGDIAKDISKKVNAPLGSLHILIVSLHMYEPDITKIETMIKEVQK